MKQLIELHRRVKNHGFRLNNEKRYLKSYQKLLDSFLEEFWEELKKKGDSFGCGYFYHEFAGNIRGLDYDYTNSYPDSKDMNKDIILAIEKCIGNIHKFITTGRFEEFSTYYQGCNYNKKEGRWSKYKSIKGNWKRVK